MFLSLLVEMIAISSMILLFVWKSVVSLKDIGKSGDDILLVVLLNDGFGGSLNSLGSYSALINALKIPSLPFSYIY